MKKSKSVFISRSVYSNSPLRQNQNYDLLAESLIQFRELPIKEFPIADWYFYYSRNGVYFSLRQLRERGILDNIKIGVMGGGTALQFESMTERKPDFVGSGNAEDVANQFLPHVKGKSVVYIRAKNSMKSIQNILGEDVEFSEMIAYENWIREDIQLANTDIAIFTSPMNVDAYFQYFKDADLEATMLIALGKSTKKAIAKYSTQEVLMPEEPSEASVKSLIDILL